SQRGHRLRAAGRAGHPARLHLSLLARGAGRRADGAGAGGRRAAVHGPAQPAPAGAPAPAVHPRATDRAVQPPLPGGVAGPRAGTLRTAPAAAEPADAGPWTTSRRSTTCT